MGPTKPGNHRKYGAKSHRILILKDEETQIGSYMPLLFAKRFFIAKEEDREWQEDYLLQNR